MSGDFNQAIILGNVTRDPEVRNTPNGQTVASFGVATNRRWTDKNGEKQEAVEFHNIVAWGKLAEIVNQILFKGRKVLVSGRLQTRTWEGQDGVKRSTTEIVANELSAMGTGRAAEGGAVNYDSQAKGQAISGEENQIPVTEVTAKKPNKSDKADEINLDDIPF